MRILGRCIAIVAALIALVQHAPAQAQDYPTRPVTLIAPWPPGGAVDTHLPHPRGESCPSAWARTSSSRIGRAPARCSASSATARAAPDGYTLVMAAARRLRPRVTIYKKLPYDPTKDFAPMALITRIPFVLVVNPSLPVKSVAELIKLAKEKPGQLSYASGGPGSPHHLYTELLKSMTGIEMTHVPYKGSAPALNDVVAGHIPLMLGDIVASLPLVRERQGARARRHLAHAGCRPRPRSRRSRRPGVPGFEGVGWVMIVAPANTPKADRRPAACRVEGRSSAMPEIQEQMISARHIPVESPSPEEQQRFINSEIVRWGKVVKQAGMAGSQ